MRYVRRVLSLLLVAAFLVVGCDSQEFKKGAEEPSQLPSPMQSMTSPVPIEKSDELVKSFHRVINENNHATLENSTWTNFRRMTVEVTGQKESIDVILAEVRSRSISEKLQLDNIRHGQALDIQSKTVAVVPSVGAVFVKESGTVNGSAEFLSRITATHTDRSIFVRRSAEHGLGSIVETGERAQKCRTQLCEGTFSCYRAASSACSSDGECAAVRAVLNIAAGAADLAILSACAAYNNL